MFAVMLIGGVALRDSGEAALQAVGAGAFFGGIAVYVLLEKRAYRRKRRGQ